MIYEDKDGKKIKFIRLSAKEFTMSRESADYYKNKPEIFNKKMRLIPSLKDLLLNYSVSWDSKDHKNHKLFNENGFTNYRGRVRIDDTMFNYIVRVGKTNADNIFYDINLETDTKYVPHAKNDASRTSASTDNISQKSEDVKYAVSDEYDYSKSFAEQIEDLMSGKTSVFYIDTKKANALLQRAGLQLPGGLFQTNGFIHSIREKGSGVNTKFKNVTETQQFKRWFGDWKNDPKHASKVLNEDGTPKVVYHGTSESFTVFDNERFNKNEASGDYVGEGF